MTISKLECFNERGAVYVGGWIDDPSSFDIPSPLTILSFNNDSYKRNRPHDGKARANDIEMLNCKKAVGVMMFPFLDTPEGVLSTPLLLALVDSVAALLKTGMNFYIHCVLGMSRSAYFTAALLMRLENWSVDEAFNKIAEYRPMIDPIPAFVKHLREIENLLRYN